MTSFPVLTILWAVPMLGAAVVMLLPATARNLAKWVALTVSLAVLAVTVVIAVSFDPAGEQYQFVENYRWIPSFGTGYILGVDGIALALIALTAVLLPLLIVAGWNDARDELSWGGRSVHVYFALTLAVEGMVLISLVSLDILLFYVFFEAMLIPMYFLIGGFGGANRSKAAVKFLLYNLFGGLIMLAAVVGLYVATANSDAFEAGTFDFRAIVAAVAGGEFVVNPAVMHLLFGGFMFAFAVKAPLWPFHRWLPDSAVEATPASAVLMMAIMDKVGTFGMIRYCGSSATPRCSANGRWHGKFAAVAMSIRTGVSRPRNSPAVCSTGTRGGVNPNHWSSDRFGSSATMRATLASGGAVDSGKRRLRHAFCWKMSIGSTWLSSW